MDARAVRPFRALLGAVLIASLSGCVGDRGDERVPDDARLTLSRDGGPNARVERLAEIADAVKFDLDLPIADDLPAGLEVRRVEAFALTMDDDAGTRTASSVEVRLEGESGQPAASVTVRGRESFAGSGGEERTTLPSGRDAFMLAMGPGAPVAAPEPGVIVQVAACGLTFSVRAGTSDGFGVDEVKQVAAAFVDACA